MKKNIIFASMVVATMFANVTAKAETVSTTKSDSNKTNSVNDLGKLLVNGQEKELENFISDQTDALGSKKEIILVSKVLDLYNNNSSAFFNLSEAQKTEFNGAVLIYVKNLEKIKTKEAINWLIKLKHTSNTINFIWSINQVEILDTNIDTISEAEVTAI